MNNHINELREKWKNGELTLGTGISLTDPSVIEICAEAGLDIVFIDLEHGSMSMETAKILVTVAAGVGLASFVRVPSFDPVAIKPVTELHPTAIVVPRIRDAKEAATAVSACKYPPKGIRGFGPGRGMRYGVLGQREYLDQADEQTMVIVQIEEAEAVNDIDAILTTPGVESIMLGPNDLSGSLGFMAQHDHPEVVAAIEKTVERAKSHNVPVGVGTGFDKKGLQRWIDLGLSWIQMNVDWASLFSYTAAMTASARELANSPKKA